MSAALSRVAVVIPAKNEQQRIADTVTAARSLPHVELVVVCDDGSTDDTAEYAHGAGAVVVNHDRNRGKAAALDSAVNAIGVLEQRDRRPECGTLLLLDADLADSAANAGPLLTPVLDDEADLVIGVLPAQQTPEGADAGGFGLVMGTARRGIAELAGFEAKAPLSGQRCLTRRAFELASPLAAGFGVEVGMTIDVCRAGLRVREVDVDLRHRASGTDLAGQLHRAKQLRDVTRALAARGFVGNALDDLKSSSPVAGLLQRFKR
ncbi:hypothetical protein FHX74_001451 [Friedmanniella endophytica]|uniref:Glucosyl-3-phosphoglycerate synthase n=1 Tax=Microlunatus kandeliicorticis TaxID=1759536 RepID=A0A7W3P5D2_9ACTN|nr:glycosyltransferase [Microlunatus kandeliicorticis]MBA8793846.1 hypothetical protein [Microlunatus kandeliicorticis]